MTDFYDAIDAAVAGGGDIMCRRAAFFDFESFALRIWQGNGKVYAGGHEWIGTMKGDQDFFTWPAIHVAAAAASPVYQMEIGPLDEATYRAIRADRDEVRNRKVTFYRLYFAQGEGARAQTAPLVVATMMMKSRVWRETQNYDEGGIVVSRFMGVTARDGNEGLSEVPHGVLTDTDQNARAARIGAPTPDRYARFVPSLSNKQMTLD